MNDELLKLRNEIDRIDEGILARLAERARCAHAWARSSAGDVPPRARGTGCAAWPSSTLVRCPRTR